MDTHDTEQGLRKIKLKKKKVESKMDTDYTERGLRKEMLREMDTQYTQQGLGEKKIHRSGKWTPSTLSASLQG